MMHKDRYPSLGPKKLINSFDDLIIEVRKIWPSATIEGSIGYERSFWNGYNKDLVAHAWAKNYKKNEYWLRIKPE